MRAGGTDVSIGRWRPDATGGLLAVQNRVLEQAGEPPVTREEFDAQFGHPDWAPGARLLLAHEGDDVVGFADVWVGDFVSGRRATLRLGVDPDRRQRGVGTRLFIEAMTRVPTNAEWLDAPVMEHDDAATWFAVERGLRPSFVAARMTAAVDRVPPPQGRRDLRVRPLGADEQELLRELHNATFDDTPRWRPITADAMRHYVEADIFEPEGVHLVEDDTGDVLGFVWADIDRAEWAARGEQVGYVESIGVLPDRRGSGIGDLLLRVGVAWLRSRGCTSAELDVSLANEEALRLYERNGFATSSQRRWLSAPVARARAAADAMVRLREGCAHGELRARVEGLRTEFLAERRKAGASLPALRAAAFRDDLHAIGSGPLREGMRRTRVALMDAVALRRARARADEAVRASLEAAERRLTGADLAAFQAAYLQTRPMPDDTWAQGPDELASARDRALLIARTTPLPLVRALVLGDEDAVSPLLAHLGCAGTCAVDADPRVLDFISRTADAAAVPLAAVRCDLRDGLPMYLAGRFDVVAADPPVTLEGIRTFARAAREALRPGEGGTLVLAIAPAWLGDEGALQAQRLLTDLGFVLVDQRVGLLETRVQPSVLEIEHREPLLGDLPSTFSDVWLLRLAANPRTTE